MTNNKYPEHIGLYISTKMLKKIQYLRVLQMDKGTKIKPTFSEVTREALKQYIEKELNEREG